MSETHGQEMVGPYFLWPWEDFFFLATELSRVVGGPENPMGARTTSLRKAAWCPRLSISEPAGL